MNAAGKVVQNLNAKKLSGEKLSRKEQIALKKSTAEFSKYNRAVLGADASIKRFQRNVGNYPKGLNAAASAARNLASAFGFTGGIFLFASALKNAFNRVREFDKAMQNIAGILRTSRKEISDLESEIIKVAGTSIKTSREVAGLAESLVTLGKTKAEIKDLLKPVNDLSIGLETTGAEAAEFLVQTLNAFGAGSDEAGKYADVIATIRTSTTLDFQKMRDSFQYLTPISRILNKDLAYTGAVIGILADNGLKAEQAGRLLGTAQQKLAKEGKTLSQALEDINEAQSRGVKEVDLLRIASDLFGKQAAKVGVVLANNTEALEVNAQAIRDNGGALDDLVKEQLEAMDAKLKILDSSYEELILTIENGRGGIATAFNESIDFLTKLIQLTTDLEKAQGKVFDVTGEQEGFFGTIKKAVPFLSVFKTDYEELVELQEGFNKANNNIDANGILTLQNMYEGLENTLQTNNDLTINQEKLYQKQLVTIQEAIDRKKDERKSIEETAIALGFNEKELGKYADKIEQYTNGDLQKFIQANQDAEKSINKLGGAGGGSVKREKIIPIEFKTVEESKKEFQDYAKKVMEVLEENFGIEAGQIDPIKLPPLESTEFKAGLTELQKLTNDFISDLSFASIDNSPLSSLATFFDGTFEDLILGADSVAEEFAITFNAIGEVAKQTFSLISELGQQNFESQLDRLSKEKEADLQFAGEGTAAREQIEEQYEERRIAIQTKQAKAQKDQAIFNAGVTTAQATLAAYASQLIPGDPTSIIRAKVAAAIAASFGLLQIGFISAQELPQFKDGVINFKGGDAVVGDGGISEVIRTPDGSLFKTPSTDTIVNLPKGSDVFSSEDEFFKDLRKLTDMNNIMFDSNLFQIPDLAPSINIENNGASAKDIDRVMGKYFSQISTNNISFDKNGIKTWMSKGNSKNILHNNRTSFKGFSV